MSQALVTAQQSWREPDKIFRATFGIWVFLASEILFFGAMLCAYAVLRWFNGPAFGAASRETDIVYGTINTIILMTSSFAIALSVRANEDDDRALVKIGLIATLLLGLAFLVVKGFEYREDFLHHLVPGPLFLLPEPAAQAFFSFYWVMTGLHAVHLTVGIAVVARVLTLARGRVPQHAVGRSLEVTALYWHVVDVIWIILYPLFYLVGRSQ